MTRRNPWIDQHRAELERLERRAPVDYGAKIRALLERHGISQAEAAGRLSLAYGEHVPARTLVNWCRDPESPHHRAAPRWAWIYLRGALNGR